MGYKAFFSYSRVDDRIANWLHRKLDSYRTPKALVGTEGELGAVPPKLHPIFRDRTDLEAGGHVDASLQSALEGSESLIVLCTPTSAKSRWVDHECATFLRLGRESRIFLVIAAGEPDSGDPETECFPPSLRGKGLLAADLREILLPNGRLIGDGREGGRLKLIAGLLGVPLDALARRERQRQQIRTLAASAAAVVFGIVAVIAVVQTIEQMRQRAIAIAERARAEHSVARFITERGWSALQNNDAAKAARYALLSGRQIPERNALAAEVLARIRRDSIVPISQLAAEGRTLHASWSDAGPRIIRQVAGRGIEVWRLQPLQLVFAHPLADGEDVCAAGADTALVCSALGLQRSVSLRDGAVFARFSNTGALIAAPALSMNGDRALSLQNGRAQVWNVRTGALLDTQQVETADGGEYQLALSPSGSTAVVVRTQGNVLVWRPQAPEQSHRFPEMLSEDASCRIATPTPWTSRFEISCEAADGFEDIWIDLSTSGYSVDANQVVYGARGAGPGNMHGRPEPMLDGPSFAQSSPYSARFYRDLVTRGETRRTTAALNGEGATIRLHPSGRIVVAAPDGREREIVFGGLTFAELSPDRRTILMAGANGDARIYDLRQINASPIASGRFSNFERSEPRGPVFSPDGRYVVAMRNVDSEALVVDVESNRSFELTIFDEGEEMFASIRAQNSIDRILFSDGRLFASTLGGRIIQAWNLANPSEREELPVEANAELMQQIRERGLELPSRQELETTSPEGRFNLTAGVGGDVLLQSRESGFAMARFEPIQTSPYRSAIFSADGRRMALLSAQGDIAVWDMSSFDQAFDEGAAWVCQNLLTQPQLRRFSESEIANDPLLRERGVDARLDLCE